MAERVEIKEKQDGSWSIWYPEEGWVLCTCEKCKHKTEHPLYESGYKPTDLEDAKRYAKTISKNVKIVPLTPKKKSDTLPKGNDEGKKHTKQGKPASSD